MKRELIEQHLAAATAKLEARAATLKGAGVTDEALDCDPVWRSLDAARRQAKTRLVSVSKLEKREADAHARAAEGGDEAA